MVVVALMELHYQSVDRHFSIRIKIINIDTPCLNQIHKLVNNSVFGVSYWVDNICEYIESLLMIDNSKQIQKRRIVQPIGV